MQQKLAFLSISFLEWLKHIDQQIFLKVNTIWTNSLLDKLFVWWREQSHWYFLYVLLLVFIIVKFKWKFWQWLLCALATVGISDGISSHILKDWIGRVRPCRDPDMLAAHARVLLGWCPSSGSFTSSHASNHFAMGVFFFLTLRPYIKNWAYLFLFWAASISYAQVYVGVHYPFDVLGGAILGTAIGIGVTRFYNQKVLPNLILK
ncbi:MAG: phosphatase PAP2 family protein [Bacteroidota bacterium]|nr:phosphatase PAP2 family protein [Bacteroidota bacterium]